MTKACFEIKIRNELRTTPLSLKKIQKHTEEILKLLKWKEASLSITFVGDRKMQRLNREFLTHDWPTDVLAFSQLEGPQPKKSVVLGDIVISIPTAKRQAKEYGNSFEYELYFYICHGILHLLGYDDKTEKEAAVMDRKQKNLLKQIGMKP